METRSLIRASCIAALIALLTGCATVTPGFRTKSETELAVAEVKTEWLIPCSVVLGPMPENQIGLLLQDYADISAALAECVARQNTLVNYLRPVVKKERESSRNPTAEK